MNPRNPKLTPPSILIHVHDQVPGDDLVTLLLGIEEEGVPVELTRHAELNPLKLAHAAAVASKLGIGIGVSLDYVVITTEKLPEDRPYIARFLADVDGRLIGGDAARVVKRLPLRGFATRTPGTPVTERKH
ncbi:glycerol dehydratase reactivation factor [Tessaracoccus sp. HDW20]|uniref:glycerol dehydratase reactivase beta/small subunit family protein n=1 Tax=Tessaracoccus coleopterorum TaxID=2714950 RepID=UPI0018D44AC6|nr:glycerol dehydratase reactivase beta/small subunit family protein [Tessaracoccus coleopterorum]NHB84674.1 glycerol dehydratase reactivation factor [Tessaracoccus coleopterorum]